MSMKSVYFTLKVIVNGLTVLLKHVFMNIRQVKSCRLWMYKMIYTIYKKHVLYEVMNMYK